MGTLIYGNSFELEVDDATLEHLRLVIFQKLRSQESFSLTWKSEARGMPDVISLWIGPGIPLRFEIEEAAGGEIQRERIEELMRMSYSVRGLCVEASESSKRSS